MQGEKKTKSMVKHLLDKLNRSSSNTSWAFTSNMYNTNFSSIQHFQRKPESWNDSNRRDGQRNQQGYATEYHDCGATR